MFKVVVAEVDIVVVRQFQINHLFNGSFATLCRQAGRKKLKLKLYVTQYTTQLKLSCKIVHARRPRTLL